MTTSQGYPATSREPASSVLRAACRRIPPQFDVRDLVAVNPFLGYTERSFLDAAIAIEEVFHEQVLPGGPGPQGPRVECVADVAERSGFADVTRAQKLSLTRFLAMHLDGQGLADKAGFREQSLFAAYRQFASLDRAPELAGLRGCRDLARALPPDPLRAAEGLLSRLSLEGEALERYLTRLLARLPGYAGYLRALDFAVGQDHVEQMLPLSAILLWQDYALAAVLGLPFGPVFYAGEGGFREDRQRRVETLSANERALLKHLQGKLQPARRSEPTRSLAQLLFCIDVRSEPYRRHLEGHSDIETYGFAGFFGLPLAQQTADGPRPLCPPLLRPDILLPPPHPTAAVRKARPAWGDLLTHGLSSPIASLVQVEAWGLSYLAKLVKDAFPGGQPLTSPQSEVVDLSVIALQRQVALAQSILKNTSLRRPLGRLVVFVGHSSTVTNNPQAGALACGACAGHGGALNARFAAALLNSPEVRAHVDVPDDVVFLAAEHDTMTEEVRVLDTHAVPQSHAADLAQLRSQLERATKERRAERLTKAPGIGEAGPEALFKRARDYSETQPEWGLAGNAAFIIGSRHLSRGASLGGRAFLHSYDESRDKDGSVLEMILTAPAVVGSWINLQYYASTVAPCTFGAGRKTLHNPTSGIGIVEGGQGDLVVGLSRESLTADGRSVHEPLRLQVLVQASEAKVVAIIERNESLRRLVAGGWLSLHLVQQREGAEPTEGAEQGQGAVVVTPLAAERFALERYQRVAAE